MSVKRAGYPPIHNCGETAPQTTAEYHRHHSLTTLHTYTTYVEKYGVLLGETMTPARGGIPMKAIPMKRPTEHKAKGGAPKGNRNALRHGLRAGKLPKDCKHIENRLNTMRRQLEDAVIRCHGAVSESHACFINTALRFESLASLAQRYLTKEGSKLDVSEKLRFSREVANASASRDRAVAMLELGTGQSSILDVLYAKAPSIKAIEAQP